MKECFSCCIFSMLIGAVVGGVLVVSNKKIENTFRKGKDMAVEKIEEIKDMVEEKTKKESKTKNQ